MSLPFKRHLDPLIRFRMAYAAYSLYFAINLLAMPLPKLLLPLGIQPPPPNRLHGFLNPPESTSQTAPTRHLHRFGRSAELTRVTYRHIHKDHATSVATDSILCYAL